MSGHEVHRLRIRVHGEGDNRICGDSPMKGHPRKEPRRDSGGRCGYSALIIGINASIFKESMIKFRYSAAFSDCFFRLLFPIVFSDCFFRSDSEIFVVTRGRIIVVRSGWSAPNCSRITGVSNPSDSQTSYISGTPLPACSPIPIRLIIFKRFLFRGSEILPLGICVFPGRIVSGFERTILRGDIFLIFTVRFIGNCPQQQPVRN